MRNATTHTVVSGVTKVTIAQPKRTAVPSQKPAPRKLANNGSRGCARCGQRR